MRTRKPTPPGTRAPEYPSDLDAEQAVLGALLRDNGAFDACRTLQPDDFYAKEHRPIFRAARELIENDAQADIVTMVDALRSRGDLAAAGGASYVAGLTNAPGTISNTPHYVGIVSRLALRRRVIEAHSRAVELALDPTVEPKDLFSSIESELAKIHTTGEVRIRGEYEIAKALVKAATSDDVAPLLAERAVTTPWRSVNYALRVHADDLVVVAGSSSSGKSMLMGQWAGHVGRGITDDKSDAKNVLVASLEMSGEQMVQRQLMSVGPGMFLDDVYRPRTEAATMELWKAEARLKGSKVRYLDRSWDLLTILREAAAMKRRDGLGMLVVDYLQIIDFSREWGDRRDEQIGMATRRMKRFASEHQVPVVFASQLRRHDGREPSIEDLRESGNIGNDANTVLIVYRPGKYEGTPEYKANDLRTVKLLIAKQRQGRADEAIPLVQQFEHARFLEPAEVEVQEPAQTKLPLAAQSKPSKRGAHA